MLHLIAFDRLDSDTARACLSQCREGDICVFADAGHLVAAEFPRFGKAFLLAGDTPPPARPAALETISHDQLVSLVAEHGPMTSWYP